MSIQVEINGCQKNQNKFLKMKTEKVISEIMVFINEGDVYPPFKLLRPFLKKFCYFSFII